MGHNQPYQKAKPYWGEEASGGGAVGPRRPRLLSRVSGVFLGEGGGHQGPDRCLPPLHVERNTQEHLILFNCRANLPAWRILAGYDG